MIHERKEVLVKVEGVSLSFDGKKILREMDLEVRDAVRPDRVQGQVVGILGPSGVGKTQFSRILAGLQEPTTGKVLVGGKPVSAGLVGMVAQDYPLFQWRTVDGNLMLALEKTNLSPAAKRDRVKEYRLRFGLADKGDLYPSQLSGGQRQRVSIIRELLCSENYMVMDEPSTGLDPRAKDAVRDLILQVSGLHEHNTLFVVAHDIPFLVAISDTLWMFGRDEAEGGGHVPGAYVKYTYDLIERGLAWRPGVEKEAGFNDMCSEVRAKFDHL